MRRGAAIRRAAVSTVWTKAGTALLYLASLPIAKHALGIEAFAAYAVLASATVWFGFINIGVGPGLAVEVAEARAQADREAVGPLFSAAVLLAAVMGAVLLALSTSVALVVDMDDVYGARIAGTVGTGELRSSLLAVSALAVGHTVFGVAEGFRLGMQQQHVNNYWAAAGQVFAAMAIVVCALLTPTLPAMVTAAFGPPVLARGLNAATLVLARTDLRVRFAKLGKGIVLSLLRRNGAYTTVQLSVVVSSQLSVILVGRWEVSGDVASFFVLSSITQMGFGLLSAVVIPYTPAVRDAVSSGDRVWAAASYEKLVRLSVGFAVIAALGLALAGPYAIEVVYGPDTRPSTLLAVVFGLLFIVRSIEYVSFTTLVGIDDPWQPVTAFVIKTIVTLVLFLTLARASGITGFAVGLLLPTAFITVPYLDRRARSVLQRAGTAAA